MKAVDRGIMWAGGCFTLQYTTKHDMSDLGALLFSFVVALMLCVLADLLAGDAK